MAVAKVLAVWIGTEWKFKCFTSSIGFKTFELSWQTMRRMYNSCDIPTKQYVHGMKG